MFFGRRKAVVFSRALDPSDKDDAPAGYTFTELTPRDFRNCALASERGRLARFERRLADGYRSAGFRDVEGRVVSYIWMARGDAGPPSVRIWRDVRVLLQGQDVFFWDCRTDPVHEGRGLYRTGLRMAGTRLASTGSRRAFIETDPTMPFAPRHRRRRFPACGRTDPDCNGGIVLDAHRLGRPAARHGTAAPGTRYRGAPLLMSPILSELSEPIGGTRSATSSP